MKHACKTGIPKRDHLVNKPLCNTSFILLISYFRTLESAFCFLKGTPLLQFSLQSAGFPPGRESSFPKIPISDNMISASPGNGELKGENILSAILSSVSSHKQRPRLLANSPWCCRPQRQGNRGCLQCHLALAAALNCKPNSPRSSHCALPTTFRGT